MGPDNDILLELKELCENCMVDALDKGFNIYVNIVDKGYNKGYSIIINKNTSFAVNTIIDPFLTLLEILYLDYNMYPFYRYFQHYTETYYNIGDFIEDMQDGAGDRQTTSKLMINIRGRKK